MNPEVWMDFTETDGQSWQPREYSQAFKDAMSEDFPDGGLPRHGSADGGENFNDAEGEQKKRLQVFDFTTSLLCYIVK